MSSGTNIEWTQGQNGEKGATWNPVVGCTRASEGCDHCYAVTMTNRLEAMGQDKYRGLTVLNQKGDRHFNGVVRTVEADLEIPLKWKKPRKVFVNSMSDLFHKDVPFEFVDRVFAVMALTPQHTYQILTKRPERMAEYFQWSSPAALNDAERTDHTRLTEVQAAFTEAIAEYLYPNPRVSDGKLGSKWIQWPLPNVWLGTSVENQEQADKRIPHLLKCPAAVRFLSVEPMLGAIDLEQSHPGFPYQGSWTFDMLSRDGIHWIICGGESGSHARPMHPQWARSLRDQCALASVPFFFKQWGAWEPVTPLYNGRDDDAENGRGDLAMFDTHGQFWGERDGQPNDLETWLIERVGKHAAGRTLDGRTWDEMPATATPVEVRR